MEHNDAYPTQRERAAMSRIKDLTLADLGRQEHLAKCTRL